MATEPRDITLVIDSIIDRLKQVDGYDDTQLPDVVRMLKAVKSSCTFTAPEIMYERWRQFGDVMNETLGNVSPELRYDLARIFRGR